MVFIIVRRICQGFKHDAFSFDNFRACEYRTKVVRAALEISLKGSHVEKGRVEKSLSSCFLWCKLLCLSSVHFVTALHFAVCTTSRATCISSPLFIIRPQVVLWWFLKQKKFGQITEKAYIKRNIYWQVPCTVIHHRRYSILKLTSGGRSVGIVRSRTKATELVS
jgi:hypothetical protein